MKILGQLLHKLGSEGSVDQAVIERERQVHHVAHDDRVVVVDHRALRHLVHAHDRHLGVVDDRRREDAAVLPAARDREGGAAEVLGAELQSLRAQAAQATAACDALRRERSGLLGERLGVDPKPALRTLAALTLIALALALARFLICLCRCLCIRQGCSCRRGAVYCSSVGSLFLRTCNATAIWG